MEFRTMFAQCVGRVCTKSQRTWLEYALGRGCLTPVGCESMKGHVMRRVLLTLTRSVLPSRSESYHRAWMNTSAAYFSLRVSISPIFRNTTRINTVVWKEIMLCFNHQFTDYGTIRTSVWMLDSEVVNSLWWGNELVDNLIKFSKWLVCKWK